MGINMTLYNISSDPNDVPKVIPEQLVSFTGDNASYRDTPDVIRPVVRVSGNFSDVINANYAYIEENGRYYYIKDKTQVTKEIFDLELEVDVLQSFYRLYRDAPIIAVRSDSGYNAFIPDGQRKFYAYEDHEFMEIPMYYKYGTGEVSVGESNWDASAFVVMTVG